MQYIRYEERGNICFLTICRPKALNALNSEVIAELSQILDRLADSNLRCVILTGEGEKAFSAGADIAEMKDMSPDQAAKFSTEGNALMAKVENLVIPIIAAVNGYALGGGCELALSCDIRLVSNTAKFALPEVSLGIPPGYGGIQRLARVVGPARAKLLALTTNQIEAETALAWGLVDEIHRLDELAKAAEQLAEKIACNAPTAVRAVKSIANKCIGLTLEESKRLGVDEFARCFATVDQKQAMRAFAEKGKPEPFTGS
jgi:enoyl-CoA hydratase